MKKIISLAICLILMTGMITVTAHAQDDEEKVIRVGWYESTYCYRDQNGERRGIAYEYQRRIAAHTGWNYEYVEDSWPNLLQMLMDGEIDILSDVSYKEERAEHMLYPNLPMGAESYYIYIDASNTEITSNDLETFNGKHIGVNKGSIQESLLQEWAEKNHLSVHIEEMTDEEPDIMSMLAEGAIDAYVSLDSFSAQKQVVPVTKIGASDYYFAVNKSRPDLLTELNSALAAIQDEDPYFNQRMFDQYVNLVNTNAFLPSDLDGWLKGHGAIRVGYLEDYLPFCALDKKTGDLTGALNNFLFMHPYV
ncbi:MAG: transporter substrate-binding domain-containing protein [Lachnospiraceae bacterium]|nr:transporter substrate-binding domain-containing protein [Lachnospiraceae bacterium]